MPEWWTYTLADFLMFSPRTYYRMIERYNAAVWPAQLAGLGAGLGLALLASSRMTGASRTWLVAPLLAPIWLWVAWAYLFERYARINWAVEYVGWLFLLEALLLAAAAFRSGGPGPPGRDPVWVAGLVLIAFALPLYPLLAPLLGRGWAAFEVFGLAPDPTALGTIGLLLAARAPAVLLVVPLLWCLANGAMLLAMRSPEAFLLLGAVPITLIAAALPLPRARRPG